MKYEFTHLFSYHFDPLIVLDEHVIMQCNVNLSDGLVYLSQGISGVWMEDLKLDFSSFTKIIFVSKFLLRGFIKLLGRRILNVNVLPIPFIITVHWHIASR